MARIRAYFKVDLYFFEHPKVVDLSHTAIVLFLASIAYANRRETDGFIARPVVRRLIEVDEQEGRTVWDVVKELVQAGLWEEARPGSVRPDTEPRPPDGPGGWWIHGFLEDNDSNEERAQRREADAARKRRARGNDSESAGQDPNPPRPGNVQPDTSGRPDGHDVPSEPVRPIAVTEQSSNRAEGKINTVVEQARPIDDVTHVFRTWQEATRKHRAQLDPKRRRRIKAALAQYPLQDVLDAVRGWQHSPHHTGQNNTGTVYNDLDLLLRDAEHLERFRDLWRDGPPTQIGKQTTKAIQISQQMHAMREEVIGGGLGSVERDRGRAQRQLPASRD